MSENLPMLSSTFGFKPTDDGQGIEFGGVLNVMALLQSHQNKDGIVEMFKVLDKTPSISKKILLVATFFAYLEEEAERRAHTDAMTEQEGVPEGVGEEPEPPAE